MTHVCYTVCYTRTLHKGTLHRAHRVTQCVTTRVVLLCAAATTSPSRISAPVIRSKDPGFRTLTNVLLIVRYNNGIHQAVHHRARERTREVVTQSASLAENLGNVCGELPSWCASRISQVSDCRRQSQATFVNAERGPFRIPCTKAQQSRDRNRTTRGKRPRTVGGSTRRARWEWCDGASCSF